MVALGGKMMGDGDVQGSLSLGPRTGFAHSLDETTEKLFTLFSLKRGNQSCVQSQGRSRFSAGFWGVIGCVLAERSPHGWLHLPPMNTDILRNSSACVTQVQPHVIFGTAPYNSCCPSLQTWQRRLRAFLQLVQGLTVSLWQNWVCYPVLTLPICIF